MRTLPSLCFGLALAALTACSNDPTANSPYMALAAGLSSPENEFTPRFITALQREAPTLQIGFVETGTSGNLLLEREDGPFTYWISPDGAQIVLQSGVLHGTRGLGEGLLASELSQPLALIRARQSGTSDRFHTYLDGNDRAETRTYRCLIENTGPQEIELTSGPVTTILMTERCRSLNQEFTNFYWVTPAGGQIVQSRQWAGPTVGAISTRIARL